jgi:DNA replication and repair protein RecF
MKLTQLKIQNVRNIEHIELTLDPKLNLFFGDNGQGKTSVLEAAGYLGLLRSFRGASNEEMILQNDFEGSNDRRPLSRISGVIEDDDIDAKLEVIFDPETMSRTASINDKTYRSSSQYLKQRFGTYELGFHAVVFAPSDHELIRGEPALRRGFLDRAVGAELPEHQDDVSRYQKAVSQKSAFLKNEGPRPLEVLDTFNALIAELGGRITARRLTWLTRAQNQIGKIAEGISNNAAGLELKYLSKWIEGEISLLQDWDAVTLQERLRIRMQGGVQKELAASSCLYGPHRDDFGFWLFQLPLQGHGSQGEVRSALLALKLTEIALFERATRHKPVLLIDDFSSELDRHRRGQLLKLLEETELQVLVSSTEDVFPFGKKFRVEGGAVY